MTALGDKPAMPIRLLLCRNAYLHLLRKRVHCPACLACPIVLQRESFSRVLFFYANRLYFLPRGEQRKNATSALETITVTPCDRLEEAARSVKLHCRLKRQETSSTPVEEKYRQNRAQSICHSEFPISKHQHSYSLTKSTINSNEQ